MDATPTDNQVWTLQKLTKKIWKGKQKKLIVGAIRFDWQNSKQLGFGAAERSKSIVPWVLNTFRNLRWPFSAQFLSLFYPLFISLSLSLSLPHFLPCLCWHIATPWESGRNQFPTVAISWATLIDSLNLLARPPLGHLNPLPLSPSQPPTWWMLELREFFIFCRIKPQ